MAANAEFGIIGEDFHGCSPRADGSVPVQLYITRKCPNRQLVAKLAPKTLDESLLF
jgi:hypothetical protein